MPNFYVDVIDGAQAKITIKGWELYRKVTVNGLSGFSGAGLLVAAYGIISGAFVDSNGTAQPPVTFGAPHPSLASALCQEISPKALGQDVVAFEVIYRQTYGQATLKTGASVQNSKTNVDINGKDLKLTYTGDWTKLSPAGQANYAHNKGVQIATVDSPAPVGTFSITKVLNFDPSDLSDQFTGATNQAGWSLKPAAPARSWICAAIIGVTHDLVNYETEFSFQKAVPGPLNVPTWDQNFYWRDVGTGGPPDDATVANGGKGSAQVLPMMDFDELNLP